MGLDRETQRRRHKEILNILGGPDPVESQIQLRHLLRERGFDVTQSSISRDMKHLGISRSQGRYIIPEAVRGKESREKVVDFIRRGVPSGPYLTILHCDPGGARAVAFALRTWDWPEIAGIMADDDTIFVATASNFDQKLLLGRLKQILEK